MLLDKFLIIYGCYFHLYQSLWRQVQNKALPFLPIRDIIEGFKYISENSTVNFVPILNYFELNNIGRIKQGERSKPRFDIALLNVNERVHLNLPLRNNDVESWHSRIKPDARQNLTVSK
ncbi:unnamed protein product [Brachionus calyciflorus]|uniref:Uncharacterized protein n=1 Tax=Brachionus calyciflorus TaxID=104777 RepID=A0A813W1E8_9BILA|nr:unnamed protein product [Brachionus calyciflorus]